MPAPSPVERQAPDPIVAREQAATGHHDTPLESLGKAITDPLREAAGQPEEDVRRAREHATPQPYPDDDDADADR
ncbi:hypothetical protein [Pseudorhodoferax sp.]|uniref:hypothetical protein n=1 Tax=Pseudorhodoferax sp. TaxID=1993553 RepID=UPI0039E6540F